MINTSTQVESGEHGHRQDRSCSELGRNSILLGVSGGFQNFKRLKFNHMVPSGFPIAFWHRGEARSFLQRANGRKAGILINEHPLRLTLSLSLKLKEIRYSSVREGYREGESLVGTPRKDL